MHRRQPPVRRRHWPHRLGWAGLVVALWAGLSGSSAPSDSLSALRLVGSGGVAAYPQAVSGARPTASETVDHGARTSVSIAGSVAGLYPGGTLPLVLTVTNPGAGAITVTSIGTVVGKTSNLCRASNIHVTKFSGKLLVPATGKATTTVEVLMAHSAPNACQGAIFPFRYHGSAHPS